MEGSMFLTICGVIITVGSVITALCTIYNFFKKPAEKYRETRDQELKQLIVDTLKENLPDLLKQHDLEVRERYKADRERYLGEIKNAVLTETQDELQQVKILGIQYEALVISAKDVLREKIMAIYNAHNKTDKKLSVIERERLDQYYKDYKALKGNSYIDKYYNRMKKWGTIDENDDDDNGDLV